MALRNGVSLRWREADALLPDLHVERALVRRVEVRAGGVGLCDGRVVVTDPVFTMRGRRGEPVEVVLATALRPTLGTALTPDGEGPAPAAGTMQVTRRDAFTAYGAWDLGSWDGS